MDENYYYYQAGGRDEEEEDEEERGKNGNSMLIILINANICFTHPLFRYLWNEKHWSIHYNYTILCGLHSICYTYRSLPKYSYIRTQLCPLYTGLKDWLS